MIGGESRRTLLSDGKVSFKCVKVAVTVVCERLRDGKTYQGAGSSEWELEEVAEEQQLGNGLGGRSPQWEQEEVAEEQQLGNRLGGCSPQWEQEEVAEEQQLGNGLGGCSPQWGQE
ncbi:uncharacterized protein PG998_004553 [Apiospora kogelbergensis]|uniref:uncharacterized protein n=1 Tax=Apiospora kogelbergensis TaxID=1337665 RepID=UPI00312E2521